MTQRAHAIASDTNASGRPSADSRAILLLCGHFAAKPGAAKPLTPAEYHALADWLVGHTLSPAAVLEPTLSLRLDTYTHKSTPVSRLRRLLDRGVELELALARWAEARIWVMSECDSDYPQRLRRRLGSRGFPLLFGAGPKTWLNDGGLCIVGSRDCTEATRHFARRLGGRCSKEEITVISSDMRGADREAITAALNAEGRVVSVLTDSLEKAVVARRNCEPLAAGHLAMVTPFAPSTRFSVSNAMRASKYQYSLSDVAVVVETRRTGGIWSGAEENRREGWVPGFVHVAESISPGNRALLHLGSAPITAEDVETKPDLRRFFAERSGGSEAIDAPGTASGQELPDLYGVFLAALKTLMGTRPHTESEIMQRFGIERTQARKWLDRAVREGALGRTGRPARYSVPPD